MPKKSKLHLNLQKNLLNVKCVTLLPEEVNDPKLDTNSQINTTIENDIKLSENIKSNIQNIIIKIIIYMVIIIHFIQLQETPITLHPTQTKISQLLLLQTKSQNDVEVDQNGSTTTNL